MSDHDEGFTLVELLIAVAVMLIIIVPIANSFVLGLTTTRGGMQDTTNSSDAQVLAGFFDTDVASAETVSTSSACAGAGTVLALSWTDGSAAETVAYRAVADPAMQAELATVSAIDRLERVHCTNGAAVETTIVARSVFDSGGITVSCDGASPCAGARPRRVAIQVKEYTSQIADAGASGHYTFSLTGTRKVTP